jgi:propanediol utilization protein/ethanolamine utilization cobalamin adenosyltransferase
MAKKVITESFLRQAFLKDVPDSFRIYRGQILTPAAKQFLKDRQVPIRCEANPGTPPMGLNPARGAPLGEKASGGGRSVKQKPEHMTHLRGGQLVRKDDPRILFRGQLDRFQAEVLLVQREADSWTDSLLQEGLQEILERARAIMRAEVLEEALEPGEFLHVKEQEIRAISHDPEKFFEMGHLVPAKEMGCAVLLLNRLRTLVRAVEVTAVSAFGQEKNPARPDIVRALNRLSSVIYVMMLRAFKMSSDRNAKFSDGDISTLVAKVVRSFRQAAGPIPVELSARHVHLSSEDVQTLFGADLTNERELSQPGQYLCHQRVNLVGPKGVLKNVAVLGPARGRTQVEVSMTDARDLGIAAPVRQSGDCAGTPGIKISTDRGAVTLKDGLIVPGRHIHMHTQDALDFSVKDQDIVRVRVGQDRSIVFENVLIRVNKNYRLAMHIDFDEGNACGGSPDMTGQLLRE